MKILAITIGDQNAGSTKYRIMQYIPFLEKYGCQIDILPADKLPLDNWEKIEHYDLVINQKCLIKKSWSKKIIQHAKKILFDTDDAIYTRPGKPYSFLTQRKVNRRIKFWLKNSQKITVANQYLAAFTSRYNENTLVIPMSLDLNLWKPVNNKKDSQKCIIGWAGAPHNLKYLELIQRDLKLILDTYKHCKLAVFSGKRPNLAIPFEYHPFEPGKEHLFTRQLDIGILPLEDDIFSRGKSPIKAIQYLACGVPVVGNIYGATNEILTPQNSISIDNNTDWFTALKTLIEDRQKATFLSKNGIDHIQNHHNLEKNSHKLWKVITDSTI